MLQTLQKKLKETKYNTANPAISIKPECKSRPLHKVSGFAWLYVSACYCTGLHKLVPFTSLWMGLIYEAKIEESEKASSRRESIPGHLWLEPPVFCHIEPRQPANHQPSQSSMCTAQVLMEFGRHILSGYQVCDWATCAVHIEGWWRVRLSWLNGRHWGVRLSWLNGRHWLLKPEVSWVWLPVTVGLFYFRLITSKFTIPLAKRTLMLVGTNIYIL